MTSVHAPVCQMDYSGVLQTGLQATPKGADPEEVPYPLYEGEERPEFVALKSLLVDGGDHYGVSALSFDGQEELLWMGSQGVSHTPKSHPQVTTPSYNPKSHAQVTPSSHTPKSQPQVTAPSHTPKSQPQVTTPSHIPKSHPQVTPSSHSPKSQPQVTPSSHSLKSQPQVTPPSHTPKSHVPPNHGSVDFKKEILVIRPDCKTFQHGCAKL